MKRNLLVVGASRGIGGAIARFFEEKGDRVIGVSRTEPEVGEWIQADVSTPEGIDAVIAGVGEQPIDALLFMGGVWEEGAFTSEYSFAESSGEGTQFVINVNLVAPIKITKGVIENLAKTENPRAVYMGATSGLEISTTREVAYSASKFGLRGAVHAMRMELGAEGIGFTVINPGYVATEEVVEEMKSGVLPDGVPVPMEDVVETVDYILRSSKHVEIGDIALTQKTRSS